MVFRKKIIEGIEMYSYVILDMLLKLMTYFSVPLFAKVMTPAEYGQYYLVISYMSIFSILLSLNVWSGIVIYKKRDNFINANAAIGIVTILHACAMILLVLFAMMFKYDVSFFALVTAISYFQSLMNVMSEIFRADDDIRKYSRMRLMFGGFTTMLGLVAVFYFKGDKYIVRTLSFLISLIVVVFPSLFGLKWRIKDVLSLVDIKKYIVFSVPLIPFALSSTVLMYFDRIVIEKFCSSSDLGIYSFSYNIAMIINVLALGLNKSYQPQYIKLKSKESNDTSFLSLKYHSAFLTAAIGFTVLFPLALKIIQVGGFSESINITYIVILSYVLIYFYAIYSNALYYYGKTKTISVLTVGAALLNLLLNIIYVPVYGLIAAAITTYLSYFFLLILVMYFRYKVDRFNLFYEFGAIFISQTAIIIIWRLSNVFI